MVSSSSLDSLDLSSQILHPCLLYHISPLHIHNIIPTICSSRTDKNHKTIPMAPCLHDSDRDPRRRHERHRYGSPSPWKQTALWHQRPLFHPWPPIRDTYQTCIFCWIRMRQISGKKRESKFKILVIFFFFGGGGRGGDLHNSTQPIHLFSLTLSRLLSKSYRFIHDFQKNKNGSLAKPLKKKNLHFFYWKCSNCQFQGSNCPNNGRIFFSKPKKVHTTRNQGLRLLLLEWKDWWRTSSVEKVVWEPRVFLLDVVQPRSFSKLPATFGHRKVKVNFLLWLSQ